MDFSQQSVVSMQMRTALLALASCHLAMLAAIFLPVSDCLWDI